MSSRHNGFTLLEVCLALMIGLLLITLAVPSVVSVLGEQRLKRSFDEFDRFVQDAKLKSERERRDYVMAWDDKGIKLAPAGSVDDAPRKGAAKDSDTNRFAFEKGQTFSLNRTAALTNHPTSEWIFWKSGICEPAQIAFQGNVGKWTVRYDPLTVRGVFLDSQVK